MKRIITIFLICLSMVTLRPTTLMASDYFVAKQPNYDTADALMTKRKNVDEAAKLTENATGETGVVSSVWTGMAEAASPYSVGVPVAGSQTNNYRVTVVVNNVREYETLSHNLSMSDIYRFKHMVFAHNSAGLFGGLVNLSVGQTITLTEGETTSNFRVAEIALYEKQGGYLNGDPEFINKLAAHAMGHDVALLTCAGTMYGNGDASHRLVVYADAV